MSNMKRHLEELQYARHQTVMKNRYIKQSKNKFMKGGKNE